MSTEVHAPPEHRPPPAIEYAVAEGLVARDRERREWTLVLLGLTALVAVLAAILALAAFAGSSGDDPQRAAAPATNETPGVPAAAGAAAATLADAADVAFEPFKRVDPTLPAPVTKIDVDVFQHVTQVSKDLAPTEVWSYAVNGEYHRGTGVSTPNGVEQGGEVAFCNNNSTAKAK